MLKIGKSGRSSRRPDKKMMAIIGFMGSGKSTVGALLAARLKMDFVDLDDIIAANSGRSISDIFASGGEETFRDLEGEALREELESGQKVISCGGGVVLREENVDIMRERCRVYLLDITEDEALERLMDCGERPLLDVEIRDEVVRRLMKERAGKYYRAAHEVIEVGDKSPEEIAEEIAERWRRYRSIRRGETTRFT